MKQVYRWYGLSAALLFAIAWTPCAGYAQVFARDVYRIPDVMGYKALKCDFHMHSVFSDGDVWPSVRAEEAWMNGLDAFALTDHLEYTPHKADLPPVDFNRSYEIAKSTADGLRVTLLHAVEITRDMPPGHLNALFLKDANPVKTDEWKDAIKAAVEQGAFIFWNHPGWTGQQPDGVEKWYDEHTELFDNGWLKGIEVVNGDEYYPLVHQWCLDKKLTMFGNSDVHDPINMAYDPMQGSHRPMTIVFAKDNSEDAIRDALMNQRTIVYFNNWLIGEVKWLGPIFSQSIAMDTQSLTLKGKATGAIQITNHSSFEYELALDGKIDELSLPKKILLPAGKVVILRVKSNLEKLNESKEFELPYRVTNLKIRPNEGLPARIKINVTFQEKSS